MHKVQWGNIEINTHDIDFTCTQQHQIKKGEQVYIWRYIVPMCTMLHWQAIGAKICMSADSTIHSNPDILNCQAKRLR